MDPNENLKRQRELAAEIIEIAAVEQALADSEGETWSETEPDVTKLVAYAAKRRALRCRLHQRNRDLAELVQALDKWRLSGGFDPYRTVPVQAIKSILEYNLPTERADYEECVRMGDISPAPGSTHVYEALTTVSKWLYGGSV